VKARTDAEIASFGKGGSPQQVAVEKEMAVLA